MMDHFSPWHSRILSLGQLWLCPNLKSQPSVTHPKTQDVAPRHFLINSWSLLMPAKAVRSWLSNTSLWNPGWSPIRAEPRRLWVFSMDICGQGRKPIFPAAVSRDIRVPSLELVISLMVQTSCQLSSNLIRLAIDWLFFPIENRGRREMLPISDREKTRALIYSFLNFISKA